MNRIRASLQKSKVRPRVIIAGILANGFGVGLTTAIQIISVPILIGHWGTYTYGTWATLVAIPAYLSVADFGLATNCQYEIAQSLGRGDATSAKSALNASILFSSMSGAVILLSAALLWTSMSVVEVGSFANTVRTPTTLLVAYAAMILLSKTFASAIKGAGHYAKGTLLSDSISLAEFIALISCAWLGFSLGGCAATLLACRSVFTIALALQFMRLLPGWIGSSDIKESWRALRVLLPRSVSASIVTISIATNLQGAVLIVGLVLSPAAVTVLITVRTLSRSIVQIPGMVSRATLIELATAHGARDVHQGRVLVLINAFVILCFGLAFAILFPLYGQAIIRLWTSKAVSPPFSVILCFTIGSLAHLVWSTGASLMISIGRHKLLGQQLAATTIASLVLLYPVTISTGLPGACSILAILELGCLAVTLNAALRLRSQQKATDSHAGAAAPPSVM